MYDMEEKVLDVVSIFLHFHYYLNSHKVIGFISFACVNGDNVLVSFMFLRLSGIWVKCDSLITFYHASFPVNKNFSPTPNKDYFFTKHIFVTTLIIIRNEIEFRLAKSGIHQLREVSSPECQVITL